MLKFTYETNEHEIKTWVDPTDGSLNFQIGNETVNIPYEAGYEMVMILKHKQFIFQEQERRKFSPWTRLLALMAKQPKETVTQLKGSRFEVA